LVGISFDFTDEIEVNWQEIKFEEKKVLKVMNGDKISSLDGYSMVFFQACWNVLKEDIMKAFRELHAKRKFKRSLNATFIVLIRIFQGLLTLKTFAQYVLYVAFIELLLRF
jgi:hypothetical protein